MTTVKCERNFAGVIRAISESQTNWQALNHFAQTVMLKKEEFEREIDEDELQCRLTTPATLINSGIPDNIKTPAAAAGIAGVSNSSMAASTAPIVDDFPNNSRPEEEEARSAVSVTTRDEACG